MSGPEETFFPDPEAASPHLTMTRAPTPTPAEVRAVEALREEVEALELGATLGEGGMGLVRLGIQRRLGREVAVKTLRPGVNPKASVSLLQEAWVTGSLEHPNVVPIYDVTMDRDALPQVVLKRIEGTCWTDLLDDPTLLDPAHRSDPVARHLDVLVSVCNAVEFAHSRGILHRDLKPDNIMVGRFGEVFLLDWGIAAALEPDPSGRFPLARDQRFPTGTPIYMAPEMASDDGSALCRETDVFLLAGLLFRLLAGRPPRVGASLYDVLSTVEEPIVLDESWPEDLRDLMARGFALDPAARPTATAFREAVERHLRRRDVLQLFAHAGDRIDALRALLDRTEPDRIEVYDLFGACRFGLREVLARWPEHQAASAALRGLLLHMATYELDQGDPRAARVLLSEIADPPPDVVARLEALERSIEADRERLARLTAEADPTTGSQTRLLVLGALGVIWLGGPTILPLFGIGPGYPRAMGVAVAQFVGTALAFAFAYRTMVQTRLNQTVLILLLLEPTMNFPLLVAGSRWGLDIDQATVLEVMLGTTLVSVGALMIDSRLMVAAVVFAIASVVSIVDPTLVRVATIPCVLALVGNSLVVWGLRAREPEAD
ncbi:MAG: serine/threonine-protein kinase [Myxococcota bacterium]